MTFYYSNKGMIQVILVEATVVAVVAMMSTIILVRLLFWAFLAGLTTVLAIYVIYKLLSLSKYPYITITEQTVTYTPLLIGKSKTIVLRDIEHVMQAGNKVQMAVKNGQVYDLSLHYLNQDDIKRLIMYFKYSPVIKKKML